MEWFSVWWNSLDMFSQVMYCIALPTTLILLIQTLMIIFGFGHDGAGFNPSDTSGLDGFDMGDGGFGGAESISADISDGSDIDALSDGADGSNPSDMGTMQFFSVQGVITFLTVFSWSGIIIYGTTGNIPLAIIAGFLLGAAAMFGVAKLLQLSRKLAQNGTLNMNNLLGAAGTVYLVIPASGNGHGKVSVTVGERLVEFDAITEEDTALTDGTNVRVTDIRSGNMLVVERTDS